MADPNLPIPSFPTLEPTSALTFNDLVTEVAYKAGVAYYGSDGTGAPAAPINAHDLAVCQRIVNKAVRKFINDGPRPSGWRWLNPIAQVDLWPQISYDPTGSTYVNFTINPVINAVTYTGCTLLTLVTPNTPPPVGTIDTSYIPRFLQSMELRQIWLYGNPPSTTPGFFLPVDEQFTGQLIGKPVTILFWVSDTQLVVDGSAITTIQTPVTNVALTSNMATITAANTYAPGNVVAVTGLTSGNAPLNGTWTVLTASATGFTFALTHGDIGSNAVSAQTYIANCPFSFAAQGDYTLPASFSGQFTGDPTFVANTNRGMILRWTTEFAVRSRRQNYNIESGTPYEVAVRLMPTPSYQPLTNTSGLMLPRRRWELMTWRISSEFLSVIFPYTLGFNDMVNPGDIPPSPFSQDEALKACCLALVEKEVEDNMGGPDWTYYHEIALPQAHVIDSRSAPKALGYFGNPTAAGSAVPPIQAFRDFWYQRPTVPVFGRS